MGWGLEGSQNSGGASCGGLEVGSWQDICTMCVLGMAESVEGWKERARFSEALLKLGRVHLHCTQRCNLQTPTGAFE